MPSASNMGNCFGAVAPKQQVTVYVQTDEHVPVNAFLTVIGDTEVERNWRRRPPLGSYSWGDEVDEERWKRPRGTKRTPSQKSESGAVKGLGEALKQTRFDIRDEDASNLPEGWRKAFDIEMKSHYYYHVPTNITSWNRPGRPVYRIDTSGFSTSPERDHPEEF